MSFLALERFRFRLQAAIVVSLLLHLAIISQISVRRFNRPSQNVVLTDVEYLTFTQTAGQQKPARPKPKSPEIVDLNNKSGNPEAVKNPEPEEPEPDPSGLAENPYEAQRGLFLPFYVVEEVPVFQSRILPAYPENAQKLGQMSKVVLEAYIDIAGVVRLIRVIKSGGETFDQAAIAALKKSVFKPARINGRPVPVKILVPYIFSLEQ